MKNFYSQILECVLFRGIDPLKLDKVLSYLESRIVGYSKGDIIKNVGDEINEVGILLSGNAYVEVISFSGDRIILSDIQKTRAFGASLAFADIARYPVMIVSGTACNVLFVSLKKLKQNSSFECGYNTLKNENIIRLLAQSNIDLHKKNDILSKRSIRQKLLTFLYFEIEDQASYEVRLDFSMDELADYLGVNRSALSREISNMQSEGLLEHRKKTFLLSKKPTL